MANKPTTMLGAIKKIWSRVKEGINKLGEVWRYYNTKTSATFDAAIKNKNYRANCATILNWVFRMLGVFDPGMYVYGKLGGTLACDDKTMARLKEKCTLVHVNGKKTVDQCLKDEWIRPGDGVTYMDIQHTNIYAGGGKWFDAGHAYCRESGEGAKFVKWLGPTVYGDQRVAYIISYPKREKVYRVRVGIYKQKTSVAAIRAQIKEATGLDCFTESFSNGTHVFCGSFGIKKEAYVRKHRLVDKGFDAKVVSPW